ncbi:hypothetical protein PAMP_015441 [Pampus punctatissimus]
MAAGDGAQLPATVAASRSVEKALEEAAASGALNLSNRKLKEFPRSARNYDLSDITHADLCKNRLCELPEELCQFISLETLSLYHNGMRSLSSSLGNLQALTYLNLSLPPSVFQLPLLRVLIVSNNKLSSLPASINSLTHLRQLDVSCNELQCLPAELGQLECLRDLNLRRNQLTTLPEEISELPLVRLDVSCNRISHVPLCYRYLRHLQSILLDNNPLQMPPAQICSKGKYHIFKYLNMEVCKRSQEELERPTGFNSCLSDQELFTAQFGGLDSGFNSVDSGSKRWSGNESADDFSERSLRMAEVTRDQRNLEEEDEEDVSPVRKDKREDALPLIVFTVNGEAEQVDFIDSSVIEEEEDPPTPPLTAPPLNCEVIDCVIDFQEQKERSSPSQTQDSTVCRSSLYMEVSPHSSASSSPLSPSSPTLEERKRPGTLFIWQERERQQQQREKASFLKSSTKTGSQVTTAPQTGSSSGGGSPENSNSHCGLQRRCATLESRLKITLPEDLGEALSNGTVLCQLVNQIRPRSVSIIHIPSPAVPKLSSAKCRLNVENFIAACRKLGIPETDMCVCSDVLLSKLPAVLRCVTALLAAGGATDTVEEKSPRHSSSSSSSSFSSLLSTDFLFFYCASMALLYVLYCYLLT